MQSAEGGVGVPYSGSILNIRTYNGGATNSNFKYNWVMSVEW
jgi:hypothetical protein